MVEPLPSVLIIDEIATRASIIEALVSAAGRTRVTLIKEKHGIAANPELTLIETLLIASMLLDPGGDAIAVSSRRVAEMRHQPVFVMIKARAVPVAVFVTWQELSRQISARL